jgi:hypothetical protein
VLLGAATGMLLLAACAPRTARASLQQLQMRASFDLSCPGDWLRLYHLDERIKGVEGCGRRLTYVESCELVGDEVACMWRLDVPGNPALRPPEAPPTVPSPPPPAAPAVVPVSPRDILRDRT